MAKHAQFGLEFGRKALEFCEDYYGIPYPLPKLDLIAVPDFAAGAMENWGAITFRENLLLHYPNITSKAGEQRICEVIAHEIAHQWFGNLVTPSDWRYLWLNESFATYFGYGVVTRYYPEWDVWDQFLHGMTDRALDRDALKETFSIELPDEKRIAINPSTAPIIYNKGGSILHQVEGYIGSPNFKEGLRHYLKKHRYASASSPDLWKALEHVSEQPISAMIKSWIEQPGFPLVEVTREADNLILTQRRFTYLPSESDQVWIIPVTIKVYREESRSQLITILLTDKSTSVSIGRDTIAYKVNYGQNGFYRVKYQEGKNLVELGKRIASKDLAAEDRWGLQNDLYALVRAGQASLNDYVRFLSFYEDEDAFLPLISIAGNLFHAYIVLKGTKRKRIANAAKSLLERVLSRIGYEPAQDERPTTSILRDHILMHSVLYGSEDSTDFARAKFSSLMRGKGIHPDIMKSIMQVGALYGDMKTFKWFDKRLKTSQSEHERITILLALGSFRDAEVIKEVQKYVLTEVPQKNKFIPVDSLASNPHAMPGLWEWFVSNVAAFEKFHPIQYERIIEAVVPVSGIGKKEQVRSFFENYMKQKDKAKDVIKLSLERLEINSTMRHGSHEPRKKA
jgi:tricorn protease interacting factor F2/3